MRITQPNAKLQEAVAEAVRMEMARKRISQQTLAEQTGWSQQRISRRIAGKVPFDVAELAAIADALGVPVATLLPVEAAA